MKTFKIGYSGNSTRFKGTNTIINANTAREAVEYFYSIVLNYNYFPEEDENGNPTGVIRDCNGDILAEPGDEYIEYDGGYFGADEVTDQYTIVCYSKSGSFLGYWKEKDRNNPDSSLHYDALNHGSFDEAQKEKTEAENFAASVGWNCSFALEHFG